MNHYRTQRLSRHELTALQIIADDGLSVNELAERIGASRYTVRARLDRAREKLAARNTAHAIAIAMRRGLVQ